MLAQRLQRSGGEPFGRRIQLARGGGQEGVGQLGDVIAALAQRRQAQPHHVQPMQKVGAEAALRHQRFQVLVGGRNDPYIHPDQFAPTHTEELAFGQHAQQAGLQRQRHVTDFVQEQRAAIGLLEAAHVPPLRAGERPGLMTEQLALQQFGRNGRRVECHERALHARRFVVQRMRHQLLAGAGFAVDQHRQRRLREAADGAEQRAHGRRVADQLRALVRRGLH